MAASFHLLLSLEFAEPSKEGQRFNRQHYPHLTITSSEFSGSNLMVGIKRQLDRDSIVGESRTTQPPLSLHTGGEKKSSPIIIRKILNAVFRNCSSECSGKHFLTFFAFSKPFKNCRPDINDFEILFVSSNRSSCSHAALF